MKKDRSDILSMTLFALSIFLILFNKSICPKEINISTFYGLFIKIVCSLNFLVKITFIIFVILFINKFLNHKVKK